MDNFGEKVTIISLKENKNIFLKHKINLDVFYNWVLNITIFVVMFFTIVNSIKIVMGVAF